MGHLKRFLLGAGVLSVVVWAAILFMPARTVRGQQTYAPLMCSQSTPISITANAQLITAANSNSFIYICAFDIVPNAADNIAIVEGTGTTCATSIAGMAGGTTAATGYNLAVNENLEAGSGMGMVLKTKTAGDNVCLLVSAATGVAGFVTYVQQPF